MQYCALNPIPTIYKCPKTIKPSELEREQQQQRLVWRALVALLPDTDSVELLEYLCSCHGQHGAFLRCHCSIGTVGRALPIKTVPFLDCVSDAFMSPLGSGHSPTRPSPGIYSESYREPGFFLSFPSRYCVFPCAAFRRKNAGTSPSLAIDAISSLAARRVFIRREE